MQLLRDRILGEIVEAMALTLLAASKFASSTNVAISAIMRSMMASCRAAQRHSSPNIVNATSWKLGCARPMHGRMTWVSSCSVQLAFSDESVSTNLTRLPIMHNTASAWLKRAAEFASWLLMRRPDKSPSICNGIHHIGKSTERSRNLAKHGLHVHEHANLLHHKEHIRAEPAQSLLVLIVRYSAVPSHNADELLE